MIIVRYISGDDVEDAADEAVEKVLNAVELRLRDLKTSESWVPLSTTTMSVKSRIYR